MRTGKIPETALRRSVLGRFHADRAALGREFYGEDCAFFDPGRGESHSPDASGMTTAYTSVCAVPGFERHPCRLVLAAANNLYAGGAVPAALMLQAVLPCRYEEDDLRSDMDEIAAEAAKQGMKILGGHTQVSDAVQEAVYTVTGIGTAEAAGRAEETPGVSGTCRAKDLLGISGMDRTGELTGTSEADKRRSGDGRPAESFRGVRRLLRPGDELVVTKWIALGGTAALALNYEEELKGRYPYRLIDRAKEFEKLMSVAKDARAVNHFGQAAVHDLSQGGIFGGLREMAERAGVGLEVDLRKIPVKQETIEICEYFDVNPYELYSAGSLLVGTEHGEALARHLADCLVPAAVIGRVTAGSGRFILNGEEKRCLDRAPQDAWYKRKIPCRQADGTKPPRRLLS